MRITRFQASRGLEAGSPPGFSLASTLRAAKAAGPASILFNISPVTGLNCRAETQPRICILIGPYYGNVVATFRPGLPATRLLPRRAARPLDETRRAGPRPYKAKSGFGRASRFVAPLIASRRIIEPIHSREYAHLIDSHCCRSFIASATNCVHHSETLLSLPLTLSLFLSLFIWISHSLWRARAPHPRRSPILSYPTVRIRF